MSERHFDSWRRAALLLLAIVCGLSNLSLAHGQAPAAVVIEGGTLIDGNGGAPVKDSVIVIEGNKITKVSSKGQAAYPANAWIIKVSGRQVRAARALRFAEFLQLVFRRGDAQPRHYVHHRRRDHGRDSGALSRRRVPWKSERAAGVYRRIETQRQPQCQRLDGPGKSADAHAGSQIGRRDAPTRKGLDRRRRRLHPHVRWRAPDGLLPGGLRRSQYSGQAGVHAGVRAGVVSERCRPFGRGQFAAFGGDRHRDYQGPLQSSSRAATTRNGTGPLPRRWTSRKRAT